MVSGHAGGRAGRSVAGRTLFLLVVSLPVLILGAAFGRMTAWVHAHGPSGNHLHLQSESTDRHDIGFAHAHEGHGAPQGLAQEHGGDEPDEPAPAGLGIDIPLILAVPGGGATIVAESGVPWTELMPAPPWHFAPLVGAHGREHCRAHGPPRPNARSGIPALLRTSHAILI